MRGYDLDDWEGAQSFVVEFFHGSASFDVFGVEPDQIADFEVGNR